MSTLLRDRMTLDQFMETTGLCVAIERTCPDDETACSHEALRNWHHFRICLWREGISGEIYLRQVSTNATGLQSKDALISYIKAFRDLEKSNTPEEYARYRNGSAIQSHPDLAKACFEAGQRQAKRMRAMLDDWYDVLLWQVRI